MKNNIIKKIVLGIILSVFIFDAVIIALEKTGSGATVVYGADNDTIVLRVCNWEEYIDTGDWDEPIDLESGDIMGVNSMVEDFEIWYHDTYGKNVEVEYSCMGTNEEMYNMLTLGDEYDLICPSEYMIMKLMSEGWLEPFSKDFFDTQVKENYYIKGVSQIGRAHV